MDTAEYHAQLARAMTEKALQERVRQLCLSLGWRYYHTHRAQHSPAGFPDVVAMSATRGRLIFAELKTERGKPTGDQNAWLGDLAYLGSLEELSRLEVYLWRPSDYLAGTIAEILT